MSSSEKSRKFKFNTCSFDENNYSTKSQQMGCASSQTAQGPTKPEAKGVSEEIMDNSTEETSTEPIKYPPGEAFEIPIVDDDAQENNGESLIKKHPPKRLQRLSDLPQTTSTTIEDLEEKLAKAEIRRQQYLQQRVESLNLHTKTKDDNDDDADDIVVGNNEDNMEDKCKREPNEHNA